MKENPSALREEAELHAYVDGRLDATARAAVQARLAVDADAAERVAGWARQKELLQALHAELLREPVPPLLAQAGQRLHRRRHVGGRWARWGGVAASLALAFAAGWGSHLQWQAHSGEQQLARARGAGEFARQALLAHTVYMPEVRHPVEVGAAQQEHLVQWLSRRLDRPLKVPDLNAAGFELVGGRLLPGEKGARAQFMYQNAAGERITLYVGAVDPAGTGGATAFRFTAEGQVASFYWVDQGFGYALAGRQPRQQLLVLAETVYRQL